MSEFVRTINLCKNPKVTLHKIMDIDCESWKTSVAVTPKKKATSTEQLLSIIKSENCLFFNSPKVNIWTVDGVCATGKSSLSKHLNIQKSNYSINSIGQNTHLTSSIGYIFSTLKLYKDNTVWDRNCFNNVTWYTIWLLLSELESDASFNNWQIYANLVHHYVEEKLLSFSNNIIIIDSNETRANNRLYNRNTNNDRLRSCRPNYIRAQNYFYTMLAKKHPNLVCLIDLDWCDGNQTMLQECVIEIIDSFASNQFPKDLKFEPLCLDHIGKSIYSENFITNERTRPLQTIMFTNYIKMYKYQETNNESKQSSTTNGSNN